MGNVSKRQQPNQRADNSQRPPMGLQYSKKLQRPVKETYMKLYEYTENWHSTLKNNKNAI